MAKDHTFTPFFAVHQQEGDEDGWERVGETDLGENENILNTHNQPLRLMPNWLTILFLESHLYIIDMDDMEDVLGISPPSGWVAEVW